MDDRERIAALAEEGKITRDEADQLLGVLDEIDGTNQDLTEVGEAARAGGENGEDGAPDRTSEMRGDVTKTFPTSVSTPGSESTATEPRSAPGTSSASSGTRRTVEVKLLAGNLRIEVDRSLERPVANDGARGEVELEEIEDGYRLGGSPRREWTDEYGEEGSVVERVMNRLGRRNLHLAVPEGWGVRLHMKAGDVSVQGPLAFLSGQLLAGDLDADELHGVDLTVKAGDVDFTLLLTEGQHRIQAVAGDLDLRLLPESDVNVKARVGVGELAAPQEWRRRKRGIGYGVEQIVGSGSAALAVDLATGDLTIGTRRG